MTTLNPTTSFERQVAKPTVARPFRTKRIAARLSVGNADLPHDISERLRVARQQAVTNRKRTLLVTSTKSQLPCMVRRALRA